MTDLNRTPTFNLKVVLRETGLKADTVRAWERRYSLPQPDRSDGGQRLYSEYDIQLLKWLVERQGEGLSISKATSLWRRLVETGDDPFSAGDPRPVAEKTMSLDTGVTISQQRQAWVEACLAFDEPRADIVLNHAFASYLPEMVCFEVLQKGLAEIGDAWFRSDATVSQEHFASALATRRLQALITATPTPTRISRILVACPPGEEHVFSPLLITFVLRRSGWDVLYLGASVPIENIQETIADTRPDLVLLSAQSLPSAASLADMSEAVAASSVRVVFGGRIFNVEPSIRQQVQGHFLTETLDHVPVAIERLLRQRPVEIEIPSVPQAYKDGLAEYRAIRPRIEADVIAETTRAGIAHGQLTAAIHFLGLDIDAALRLGDITYLDIELEWLASMLASRQVSRDYLEWYLDTYLRCCAAHLTPGHPLLSWNRADLQAGEKRV